MSHSGFATTGYEKSRRLRLWGRPPGPDVRGQILETVDSITGFGGRFSKDRPSSRLS
jgi:hypothetical protein